MLLEEGWQRAELARSVILPILGWPDNRLPRTALRAAAELERWALNPKGISSWQRFPHFL
jgi:hypothetical protein